MKKETTKCGLKEGLWTCEKKREQKDGSMQTIAEVGAKMDGQCNLVVQKMEGDDASMNQLHEHMLKTMKGNCVKN